MPNGDDGEVPVRNPVPEDISSIYRDMIKKAIRELEEIIELLNTEV